MIKPQKEKYDPEELAILGQRWENLLKDKILALKRLQCTQKPESTAGGLVVWPMAISWTEYLCGKLSGRNFWKNQKLLQRSTCIEGAWRDYLVAKS